MSAPNLADELALRAKTINLNAGPSPLPLPALLQTTSALLSNPTSPGLGIAEISHRSAAFQKILEGANADLRTLLAIPANYKVLWMQGGGLTQFSATVLNLEAAYRIKHKLAKEEQVEGLYAVTGSWSQKACEEATRMGIKATKVVNGKKSGKGGKYSKIPPKDEWAALSEVRKAERKPAFIYYCDNETVDGVEFAAEGDTAFPFADVDDDVPVVCDMSSNFLSRPVDVSKYGVIYAGAQKNLGPAGVTVLIVRDDLIVDTDLALPYGGARVPCMLAYKNLADSDSMYNTPPTLTIYICSLVLSSLLSHPPFPLASPSSTPLSPLAAFASRKSSLVYNLLDASQGFYNGTVDDVDSRSRMNVTFRIDGGESVEKKFVKEAKEAGIEGVAGHRSVGGIRTSLYNAVTLEQVETLVRFMTEFAQKNGAQGL